MFLKQRVQLKGNTIFKLHFVNIRKNKNMISEIQRKLNEVNIC